MEVRSKERYIRTPARKLRRVINEVRGKKVPEALTILKFMPYFAAKVVEKNLVNAAANASEKWGVVSDNLIVSEIYADEGPTYKRARPRAQGRMYKIMKRTSHLTVQVKVIEK
jgi:large subunit ribosomal protein L22